MVSLESEPSPGMPESDLCDDDDEDEDADDVHRLPAPPQADRSWESGRLPRMLDADTSLLAKLMTRSLQIAMMLPFSGNPGHSLECPMMMDQRPRAMLMDQLPRLVML